MGMGPMRMRNMGGGNRLSPYDRMDRPAFGGGYGGMRGGRGMAEGRRGAPMGSGYDNDRVGSYGRGREDYGTGHRVLMRGLPYKAVEREVYQFFKPLNPVAVNLKYGPGGRSSGVAEVEFNSHEEAVKAMDRDKEKIQHRYIELFLNSSPEPFRRGSDGFDSMGAGFPPGEDRHFGIERSFSAGRRSFPGDGERSFPTDRGYGSGGADRGFGTAGTGERGYPRGFGPSTDRGFSGYSGADRGYGASASPDGRSYGATAERAMPERSYGMGGGGEFRNGMSGASGAYRRESGYGGRGFGQDGKEDSEFYGSGKLFGENNFQSSMSQGMNSMMGGANYTSF